MTSISAMAAPRPKHGIGAEEAGMKNYVAYCAACDCEVLVKVDPDSERPVDLSDVVCLERVDSCDAVECPLMGASGEELLERLEFLPLELHGQGERSLDESEELVKKARISALRRGTGRGHEG
jgi:hypothetical protein